MLGASNGEIKTLISQGTISKLLLEEMGLNIGNVILTRLAGDKQVKLNCMATDFGVTNGVMQTRSFIVDTDDAILDVSGNINLTQEQLDLTIKPNSKGLACFRSGAALCARQLQGAARECGQGCNGNASGWRDRAGRRGAGAALLPLINTGPRESSECARLLAAARVKPVAPPPGKTYHGNVKRK